VRTHRHLLRPAAVAAVVVALLAVSACRTSPGVAAYVGDEVITATALDEAVRTGLDNEVIAELFQDRIAEYRTVVLQDLIATEVYDEAAARYGAEVSTADVSDRLNEVLAQSGDPEAFFAQQAAEGRTEDDVREQVRRFILGEEIAEEAGLDEGLSDSALQEVYDMTREQFAQFDVGLVTVVDQATADDVLAQLTANPTTYAEVAAEYPNENTLPAPQSVTAEQLTSIVPDPASLVAGQGFAEALVPTGEITVVFITGISYPSFEDIRPTLEQQAAQAVQAALDVELQSVRDSLDITVNPRYGTFDDSGTLVPDDRGVVDVLDAEQPDAEPVLN